MLNRTKTAAVDDRTRYEAYYSKKAAISHLWIFGFGAYVHVHTDTRSKLDSHSRKGIFIGYNGKSKAYKVYDPVKKQVLINHDVVFEKQNHQLERAYKKFLPHHT